MRIETRLLTFGDFRSHWNHDGLQPDSELPGRCVWSLRCLGRQCSRVPSITCRVSDARRCSPGSALTLPRSSASASLSSRQLW